MIDVRDFGAAGNGAASDTKAVQASIDECAIRGGGTVHFPPGRYLCGSLFLKSRTTLDLEAGAVIAASRNPDDFPLIEARWEGETRLVHAPVIGGSGLVDIAVTGRGTIDGSGDVWWELLRAKKLAYPRPRLISFTSCSGVLIRDITAVNSPCWTVNPVACSNLLVDGLTIVNPPDSPNTDGINPDSCSRVRISNCFISVGDDCIALKSGTERESLKLRAPCRDIAITNCVLERGHGGVVIGSEMSGGVQNVVISNCIFNGTDRGIRIKSRRGRGGVVEDVRVGNVVMNDVLCPITMNLYYGCGAWGDPVVSDKGMRPVNGGTPRFRRISFNGITARGVKHAAAFIYGLAEAPVEDVSVIDASISFDPDAEEGLPEMADGLLPMRKAGFFARYTRGLFLSRVRIEGVDGPAFRVEDSESFEIRGCGTVEPDGESPSEDLRMAAGAAPDSVIKKT